MQIGIVGIPYSGKSTIFSTLMPGKSSGEFSGRNKAAKGMVLVPDNRLDKLTEIFQPKKQVNTTIEYIKVPGLEKEAAKSGNMPAGFLANLKPVDAILLVVRDFENDMFPHPFDRIDPQGDIEFVNSEFLLSDMTIMETRIEKLQKSIMKIKRPEEEKELALLLKCRDHLETERPLREMKISPNEEKIIRGFQFLSQKPILYVLNITEDEIANTKNIIKKHNNLLTPGTGLTAICAEIEKEIAELDEDEQDMFMEELGIEEPALNNLIRKSYDLLGLISFFTSGEDECRSWTIRKGSKAPIAGGAIHSDIEKGFIRANVVAYDDFIEKGSMKACKDAGTLRLEGKEYIVQDGDMIEFRFNV